MARNSSLLLSPPNPPAVSEARRSDTEPAGTSAGLTSSLSPSLAMRGTPRHYKPNGRVVRSPPFTPPPSSGAHFNEQSSHRDSPSLSGSEGRPSKTVREVARLENEVAFLKGLIRTAGTEDSPQPVYLIPSEFFFSLKEITARCFAAIEVNLAQLGQEGEQLSEKFQTLREKTDLFLRSNAQITTELIVEILDSLAEAEDIQREAAEVYRSQAETGTEELSALLEESHKVMQCLADRSGMLSEEEKLIWSERKTALRRENASFSLMALERRLLGDFERMKQKLLGQLLDIAEFQRVDKPRAFSPLRKTFSHAAQRYSPALISSDDLRSSTKRSLIDLFDSLSKAKSEVGKWSWKESPLKTDFSPRFQQGVDVETALRVVRNDIEEITKVVIAERSAIEARVFGVNDRRVEDLEVEAGHLTAENQSLRAKLAEIAKEFTAQQSSLSRAQSELQQLSKAPPSVDQSLLQENDLLHAEISELKHALQKQTAELIATTARVSRSCGLSASAEISELEAHVLMLNAFYQSNKEYEVMESSGGALGSGYVKAKFLTIYGVSESNVTIGMKYLIDKTETIAKLLEGSSGSRVSDDLNMQDLQKLEFELLDVISTEASRLKASCSPLEAEVGLLKRKQIELTEKSKQQVEVISALQRELAAVRQSEAKESQLEEFISELNEEIHTLRQAVSALQANLELTELKIDFDIPFVEAFERPQTRLSTELSVEERLLRGFEMLIERALVLLEASEEVPEGLLEKQKFVYDKMEAISDLLAGLKSRAETAEAAAQAAELAAQTAREEAEVAAQTAREEAEVAAQTAREEAQAAELAAQTAREEAQTAREEAQAAREEAQTAELAAQTAREEAQTAREEAQTYLESYNAVNQQLAVLQKQNEILGSAKVEIKANFSILADNVTENCIKKCECATQRLTDLVQKLETLIDGKKVESAQENSELQELRDRVTAQESDKAYLFAQLQVAEATCEEVPLGSTVLERLSAICDEAVRRTATALGKDADIRETVCEKLRVLFDNFAEMSTFIETQRGNAASLAGELARAQQENQSLLQQLSISSVTVQWVEAPTEVIEVKEEHAVTEESLAKGFELSIARVAAALKKESNPPENLLEKQRYLYDLITELCGNFQRTLENVAGGTVAIEELYNQMTAQVAAFETDLLQRMDTLCARQSALLSSKKTHPDIIPEVLLADITVVDSDEKPRRPSTRLYDHILRGNRYLIERASRVFEEKPYCPGFLLDQQACLHLLISKLATFSEAARGKRPQLRDSGDTYKKMYGDAGIIDRLNCLRT